MKLNSFAIGRYFDQWVCSVVCFFLMVIRALGVSLRLLPYPEKPDEIRRVLFIKIVGYGSIVLASPAIRAVKRQYPEARIAIVTLAANREVVSLMNLFDEIIVIDTSGGGAGSILNSFGALRRARAFDPDVVFDLEIFANLSSIFIFLLGNVFSVGFGSFKVYRDVFYNATVAFDHSHHIIDIYLKMVDVLDVDGDDRRLICFDNLADEAPDKVAAAFPELPFGKAPVIFVNINAGDMAHQRRMPLGKMREILEETAALPTFRAGICFALIGAPGDAEYVNAFQASLSPSLRESTISLAGKTSIHDLLRLYRHGSAYLGNDSGPLHLAASVGLTTVAFFGPETPRLYGHNAPPHRMFYNNRYCSPCMNSYHYKVTRCRDNICLRDISTLEIIQALATAVEQSGGNPAPVGAASQSVIDATSSVTHV